MELHLIDLTKTFGSNTAVDVGRFSIGSGEILGLVGNNGAGKTTLFRLILDLIKANSGRVEMEWGGQKLNPAESEEWKQVTGAYIDEGFLIDFLTPEEYFAFVGKVCGMQKSAVDERLKLFEHFMNGEVVGHKKLIRDLSAGNKQKVGIISALLHEPQLVILDEPFNFLDPTSQNVLKHLLKDYQASSGATILISSHNLSHTIDISTRIALLEHGHIINDISNENGSAGQQLEAYFNQQ